MNIVIAIGFWYDSSLCFDWDPTRYPPTKCRMEPGAFPIYWYLWAIISYTFNLIGTLTGHCSTCASNLCAICVVSFQTFLLFLNHFLSLRIFRNHIGICQLVVVNHNVFDPPSSKKNKFLTFYMHMSRNRICSQVLIP